MLFKTRPFADLLTKQTRFQLYRVLKETIFTPPFLLRQIAVSFMALVMFAQGKNSFKNYCHFIG